MPLLKQKNNNNKRIKEMPKEFFSEWSNTWEQKGEPTPKKVEQPPPPEKTEQEPPLEKNKLEKTPEEIVEHFKEELKKIEDLPQNTEYQKRTKAKETIKLINGWLPFGNLDDFSGLQETMTVLEELEEIKPKKITSFPISKLKEHAGQRIAFEMALQYKIWNKDEQEKTEIIENFINEWLKNKSAYYNGAENFKRYLLKLPKRFLKSRWDYFLDKKIEPNKTWQWLSNEISTHLKFLGKKDRTIAEVSKILAMQNIPYSNFRSLINDIENQNIQRATEVELLKIEEMTEVEQLKLLMKAKQKFGTLPELPKKIEFYENQIDVLLKESPEKTALVLALLESYEAIKDKKAREKLEELKNKVTKIVGKEKNIPKPKVIQKVKEFIKEESGKKPLIKNGEETFKKESKIEEAQKPETKKESLLSTIGGTFGFGLILLLIIFLLVEFKAIEYLSKEQSFGGKK